MTIFSSLVYPELETKEYKPTSLLTQKAFPRDSGLWRQHVLGTEPHSDPLSLPAPHATIAMRMGTTSCHELNLQINKKPAQLLEMQAQVVFSGGIQCAGTAVCKWPLTGRAEIQGGAHAGRGLSHNPAGKRKSGG